MKRRNIEISNFNNKKKFFNKKKIIKKIMKNFFNSENAILSSMRIDYKDSFKNKVLSKYKKIKNINLIGMGGSVLGAKAIYDFLKINKKKFKFIDNISNISFEKKHNKNLNIVISKSGNTLETICNSNILLSNSMKNIFLTENKESYLINFARQLKADLFYHHELIGGRYSVLSEVGMLPAKLMGLKIKNFRRFDQLIKNKFFINSLIDNVASLASLYKSKKINSIILNYDESSSSLFSWYQQLVSESLGKKNKGILPTVSSMPRDNHSMMQYYLDGPKNNFFTFFFVRDRNSNKINNNTILKTHNFLKNKSLNKITYSQLRATQNVFKSKKIPFRTFLVNERNEETLGELFSFFILETILLGKFLKINPFDQPAVELIKTNTKKILKTKNYF